MEWLSKALLSLFLLMSAHMVSAQDEPIVVLNETDTIRPTKYIAPLTEKPKLALFQGLTFSADILGPIIYLFSDYGSTEAALRLNLKNTYFPIIEVGYGKCKSTDVETNISYSTSAPFFRAGIDFNILKNKYMDNRLYVGARYGISSFKFDMSGPVMTDPIWEVRHPTTIVMRHQPAAGWKSYSVHRSRYGAISTWDGAYGTNRNSISDSLRMPNPTTSLATEPPPTPRAGAEHIISSST